MGGGSCSSTMIEDVKGACGYESDSSTSSCCHHRKYLQVFAAILAVLITETSQSRQHVSDLERKFINSSLVTPSFASRCSSTKATDAKSESVDGGFVASVIGGGVGVDNSGGRVKDCNDCRMTVENTSEESKITEKRSVGVCWLEAQYEEVRKKSLRDFHKTHLNGSGIATKPCISAAIIKPSVTNKGTDVKPEVPDVMKEESSESEAESWENDDDDNNNEQDLEVKEVVKIKIVMMTKHNQTRKIKEEEIVKTPSYNSDDEDETKIADKVEGDEDEEMDYTTSMLYDDEDIRLNEPVDTDKEFVQEMGTDDSSSILLPLATSTFSFFLHTGSSVETGTIESLEEAGFLNFCAFLGGTVPVAKPRNSPTFLRGLKRTHSIKDDVPLVSVYTIGNISVRGMLIPDAFLTTEIRETGDFKETTPRAHRSPTISADPPEMKKSKQTAEESSSPRKSPKITIKRKKIVEKDDDDSKDRIEPRSHKDNPEFVDDDKVEEKHSADTGSLEIRNEETICMHHGYMIQGMEIKCITAAKFWETHNKIDDILHEIVPQIADNEFNAHAPTIIEEHFKNYVQSNVVHIHPTTTTSTKTKSSATLRYQLYLKMKRSLQDRADDIALWEALIRKFEKSSPSSTSCREDDFHSHDDEHQDDDAPPEGEKRVKRRKESKRSKSARGSSSKHLNKDSTKYVSKQQSQQQEWDAWEEENVIDEDEVILKDETPELIAEFQNVDKRVPTIFDRARMEATIWNNQQISWKIR
nr:hypothetical protein [Tanacetum cinerariifolium]